MGRVMRAPRQLTDMTSAEAGAEVRGATVVWAIGSIEQHGPHLPLSVDLDIPDAMAQQLAADLDAYVLPAQPVSARSLPQSGGGLSFPGTVYVRGAVLIEYLRDVLCELARLRPGRIVVLNGHYENEALLFEAIDTCRLAGTFESSGRTEVVAFSWWSLVDESWVLANVPDFPGWHAEHAGFTETSLMLFLRPEVVGPARPSHATPPRAGVYLHPIDERRASHGGALSSSAKASAEAGESLFWHVVGNAGELLRSGTGLSGTGPRP